MKKNIICIDLDKLEVDEGHVMQSYSINAIKAAKVPTPCTLTDAVGGFDLTIPCLDVRSSTKEDVELFKENYLYKPEYEENEFYICDWEIMRFEAGNFINGKGEIFKADKFNSIAPTQKA